MSSYEYNKGYVEGYERACADMQSLIQGKIRETKGISPIDEMYGRDASSVVVGATGIPTGYKTEATSKVYNSYKYSAGPQGHAG